MSPGRLVAIALIWIVVASTLASVGWYVYRTFNPSTPCTSSVESMPRILQQTASSKILNILPRRMWGWGLWAPTLLGYCGESSVQISATYYGNYISQEQVTKAAGGSLLIGVNDNVCMPLLGLVSSFYPPVFGKKAPDIYTILQYIKTQIDNNNPVILGLYCNEDSGDPSYDHQVVAIGYDLNSNGKSIDTLYLLDTYQIRIVPFNCKSHAYQCSSGASCDESAQDCSGDDFPPDTPVGPPNYPNEPFPICYKRRIDFSNPQRQAPYGIAIPNIMNCQDTTVSPPIDLGNALLTVSGNNDPQNELLPCWLLMDSVYEPNWGSEDQIYAPPGPVSCDVYIEGLTKGRAYSLLRFDNPYDLPVQGDFINSQTYTLRIDFVACGKTTKIHVADDPQGWPFKSDGAYFFRCVRTNGVPMRLNFPLGTDRVDHTRAPTPPDSLNNPSQNRDSNTWNMTGWRLDRFRDVVQRRITDYANKRTNKFVQPRPTILGQCNDLDSTDSSIACGKTGTGWINNLWEWTFPDVAWDGTPIGCMTVWMTVQDPVAESPNCVNFTVDNDSSDPNPPFKLSGVTGVIIYDTDGGTTNPRMYIEDVTNSFTYCFSPNPQNADASFTMLSQDGVTVSTLRPVYDSSTPRSRRKR